MKETLSTEAKNARRHYMNVERWENKAKKLHGENYKPAEPGETISTQAREIKRAYSRGYRHKHPEIFRNANHNYWERKAKKGTDNE